MPTTHLTPCLPLWVLREREGLMQVVEQITHCVGFIGMPTERGFLATGSCFFVQWTEETEAFIYMITAKHLVRPFTDRLETQPATNDIWVRINSKQGKPKLVKTAARDWVPHSDRHVDVCIHTFDLRAQDDDLEMSTLALPAMALNDQTKKIHGLNLGDGVFIPSVFVGRIGENSNIPVLRTASIAALPLEPIRFGSPSRPAYLVETHSLGGTSGAPVFLHTQPSRIPGGVRLPPPRQDSEGRTEMQIVPYILLGMVLGSHGGQYGEDFVVPEGEERIISTDAEFNAGLSVVVPIDQILEVLDMDKVRASRTATIEALKKESGYRPSSAHRPKPVSQAVEPEAENPDHLEDFNRLLNAAVKSPKSVG